MQIDTLLIYPPKPSYFMIGSEPANLNFLKTLTVKLYILTLLILKSYFGTAKTLLKTRYLERAIWHYLKQLVLLQWTFWKQYVSKACILMVFEMFWNCKKYIENNDSEACILVVFETIWNCIENIENNVPKACILTLVEIIWNCRETNENSVSKACILTYLKRFGTA